MIKNTRNRALPGKQKGAVLVIGLVMLVVITVLGVSGMNGAALELTMAGNAQFHQQAFQAAETGIDISISSGDYITSAASILPVTPIDSGDYTTEGTMDFSENTPVPDDAFSMGVGTGSVQAFHFDVLAIGRGPANAQSTHNQSFYVVGPGGS